MMNSTATHYTIQFNREHETGRMFTIVPVRDEPKPGPDIHAGDARSETILAQAAYVRTLEAQIERLNARIAKLEGLVYYAPTHH